MQRKSHTHLATPQPPKLKNKVCDGKKNTVLPWFQKDIYRVTDESDNEQYSGTDTGSDSELERGRCREERGSCRDDDCVDIRGGASGNQVQKPSDTHPNQETY